MSSLSTRAAALSSICRSRVVSLPLACSGFTLLSISFRNVATVLRLLLRPGRPHRLPGAHYHACNQNRATSALAVAKPNRWRRTNLPTR